MTKEIDLSKIISKDLLIVDSVSKSKQEVLLELAKLLEKKVFNITKDNIKNDQQYLAVKVKDGTVTVYWQNRN